MFKVNYPIAVNAIEMCHYRIFFTISRWRRSNRKTKKARIIPKVLTAKIGATLVKLIGEWFGNVNSSPLSK